MADLSERVSVLEGRSDTILQLLQKAVNAVSLQRERIDDLEGRLKAHTLITTTVLHLARTSDPAGHQRVIGLLEATERDLARASEDEVTVRELREILATLRATSSGSL